MTAAAGTSAAPGKVARRRPSGFALFWGLPIVLWQALFFLSALGFLVVMTFWVVKNFRLTPDFAIANWVKTFSAGYFHDTYLRTLAYAALAAVVASLAAFPCAFALAFRVPPAVRRAAIFLLVIPFFTSYLVRIYSWKILLTDEGVINLALDAIGLGPYRMYNNLFGTTVGYMTLVFPLVILLQLLSLANVDRSLVEAAHNLRCGRLRTVFLVIIPSARAGLVLALTFAFILAFGDFVAPSLLGGSKPPTLSILMVDTVRSGSDWPRASVIALTMVVTLLAAAFAAMRVAYGGRAARR